MSDAAVTLQKQVLSLAQPTGNLHAGRYFGAVQNWARLQDQYDCIYGIANYHAMTMPYDPRKLNEQVWNLAFDLVAAGLDTDNMFIQSLIPEHAELAWIFNCVSAHGEIGRMTQFKDKSQQVNEKDKDAFISLGLFTYPVLQAADILIYRADFVPVGKDQEQHLELTRNIALRFNQVVGQDYFRLPEPLFSDTPKIMSTADPTRKMSASAGLKHNINLFDTPEVIRKQIRSAVTDSGDTPAGSLSPGVENLFTILRASGGQEVAAAMLPDALAGNLQYGKLKDVVADYLIAMTDPIRVRRAEITADKRAYKERIIDASEIIRRKAAETVREVKDLVGLLNVRGARPGSPRNA